MMARRPPADLSVATAMAGPPETGTRTISYHGFSTSVRPRRVSPDPRAAIISRPSGDHAVWAYSANATVMGLGAPGAMAASRTQTCAPFFSSQVVKASVLPSGDQDGEYSKT